MAKKKITTLAPYVQKLLEESVNKHYGGVEGLKKEIERIKKLKKKRQQERARKRKASK